MKIHKAFAIQTRTEDLHCWADGKPCIFINKYEAIAHIGKCNAKVVEIKIVPINNKMEKAL